MINYYEFVVIGAGVAGITAISKLLDANISNIAWVDTDFTTTGMLADWRTVDANTTIDLIEDKFLMKSESFKYSEIKHKFGLQNLGGKETCKIGLVVDILLHISKELQKRVPCFEGFATWSKNVVTIGSRTLQTKRIILATGSKPKLPVDVPTNFLCVEDALNISRLATLVKKDAKVAVFGSSHSSLLIIRDLLSLGAHVLNFYRSEIIYAYESACGNNINWYTGLKGKTAEFARSMHLLPGLTRIPTEESNKYLDQCDHVVYAIGFEPNGNYAEEDRIYGVGIAFAEVVIDFQGKRQEQVGWVAFIQYLDKMIPIWMKDER